MVCAEAAPLRVIVAYSPQPREVDLLELSLPAGATVDDALRASGLLVRHPAIQLSDQKIGIWGKTATLETLLRDGDRVELYRPLQVDPKEARRVRYRSHRERIKKG